MSQDNKPREFWIKAKPYRTEIWYAEPESGQVDLSPHYIKYIEKSYADMLEKKLQVATKALEEIKRYTSCDETGSYNCGTVAQEALEEIESMR